jgi:hypothetical protein
VVISVPKDGFVHRGSGGLDQWQANVGQRTITSLVSSVSMRYGGYVALP